MRRSEGVRGCVRVCKQCRALISIQNTAIGRTVYVVTLRRDATP